MHHSFLKKYLFSIIITVFAGLAGGLFLLYGPYSGFRTTLVTTAMATLRHQWLATTFYDDGVINKILNDNKVFDIGLSTDNSLVEIDSKKIDDPRLLPIGKQPYKIIDIEGTNYKGHVLVIYNPSKIKLGVTSRYGVWGEWVSSGSKDDGALVAVNAAGFPDAGGHGKGERVTGLLIKDGEVYKNESPKAPTHKMIGFDKKDILTLYEGSLQNILAKNYRDAVEFYPFLIVNGEPTHIVGNGGLGIGPMTLIGQRKEGTVIFVVVDGRQPGHSIGITAKQAQEIMTDYGCFNAARLDGGSSSILVENGITLNKPSSTGGERWIPAWFELMP